MSYCKRVIIFCFLFICSVQLFAQAEQDITGLWKGTMYNDTTQQFLKYEIAISEKKGKLYGYSHTYFIVDDKEYHGVKKVKISRQKGKIIVEDIDLIAHNYPIQPNKGVRQLDVLTLEIKDGVMSLEGPFSTRRTKLYSSLTGLIDVQRKGNFRQSALVPHLQELGLADDLSFVEEEKIKAAAIVKTENGAEQSVVTAKPSEKEKADLVTKVEKPETVKEQPIAKVKPAEKEKSVKKTIAKSKPTEEPVVEMKTETVKVIAEPVVKTKPEKEKPVRETEKVIAKKEPEKPVAAANIRDRIIETIQSVNYTSDSLVLTLYDNGEVDGDTVSVLMNGEVIMPNVGLSTNAVRKVIYTKDLPETIQIVMYAETLGSLPPNTGLLIVYDGKERYEIRFSGDLKKNAAIEFKRKEK